MIHIMSKKGAIQALGYLEKRPATFSSYKIWKDMVHLSLDNLKMKQNKSSEILISLEKPIRG